MDRKDFFEKVKEDYFVNRSCDFEGLKSMICGVMGVEKLETEITEKGNEKHIVFIEKDEADIVIAPKGFDIKKENLDMSGIVLKLTTDKEGTISTLESGLSFFTPANKNIVLFLGSLIGKKIIF